MYEIKVKTSFSAAHNLKNYHGKCENLHGHNWTVDAAFAYDDLDASGLAVDFKIAKEALKAVVEKFDHAYLNELKDLGSSNPTSENLARIIYAGLKKVLTSVKSVSVWENEGSCATYTEEGSRGKG